MARLLLYCHQIGKKELHGFLENESTKIFHDLAMMSDGIEECIHADDKVEFLCHRVLYFSTTITMVIAKDFEFYTSLHA